MIFPTILARGINDLYFFYSNLIEFLTLFFIRTRSSIKFYPKMITILNVVYIFYLNSYFYSSQYEAFSFLCQASVLLTLFFIKYYE